MLRKEVVSSNIQTVGYRHGSLYLRFNSGVVYSYDKVPFELFNQLTDADSVGKTFHKEIKGKFEYKRLDHDPFKGRT